MKKLLSVLIAGFFTVTCAYASQIDRVISKSNVNPASISISVKEMNGKVVYEKNSKKPMIPASTLKTLTYTASLNELGEDYEFVTSLYKTTNNELIFKLGADPFLTSFDIKQLLRKAKEKNIISPKAVKVDSTILDKNEWGEGWQWDDDLNPLMPKFSAYNMDKNLLTLYIYPTQENAPANLKLSVFYPINFMNLVVTANANVQNNIKITRNNSISPDLITVEGVVSKDKIITFPVNYPKRYFFIRLDEMMRTLKLKYYGNITEEVLPQGNIYLVDKVAHNISDATIEVMQNSNNMVAETVFKLAGGHFASSVGTSENAVEMFKNYCKKININTEDIKIVDGSGVSKNNLVTADFMTDFLVSQDTTQNILQTAGEGTLSDRMLYFGKDLKAKTGTLSDVSALTGYITSKSGKTYAFDIMINDAKSKMSEKKMLEEYILRVLYSSY